MAKNSKTPRSNKKPRYKRSRSLSSKSARPRATPNMPRKKRASTKSRQIPSDDRFEAALKYLREGRSQKRSAEIGMISVKRFRDFIRSNKLAKFQGGRWRITDRRIREITVISEGKPLLVKVRGFSPASLAMRHRASVHQFLDSNDASLLTSFEGAVIRDVAKRKHVLETRPNVLLRMANTGNDAEIKIYRLID
jgi:hypothetical protein